MWFIYILVFGCVIGALATAVTGVPPFVTIPALACLVALSTSAGRRV